MNNERSYSPRLFVLSSWHPGSTRSWTRGRRTACHIRISFSRPPLISRACDDINAQTWCDITKGVRSQVCAPIFWKSVSFLAISQNRPMFANATLFTMRSATIFKYDVRCPLPRIRNNFVCPVAGYRRCCTPIGCTHRVGAFAMKLRRWSTVTRSTIISTGAKTKNTDDIVEYDCWRCLHGPSINNARIKITCAIR